MCTLCYLRQGVFVGVLLQSQWCAQGQEVTKIEIRRGQGHRLSGWPPVGSMSQQWAERGCTTTTTDLMMSYIQVCRWWANLRCRASTNDIVNGHLCRVCLPVFLLLVRTSDFCRATNEVLSCPCLRPADAQLISTSGKRPPWSCHCTEHRLHPAYQQTQVWL